MRDGLAQLALGLVNVAEIAEMFIALVPRFSAMAMDRAEMRDGVVVLTFGPCRHCWYRRGPFPFSILPAHENI